MSKNLHNPTSCIRKFKKFILCTSGIFLLHTAQATEWFVNDGATTGDVFTTATGNDANAGTAAAPFASLQFAIDAAVAGDTIYVDAGTYVSGDVTISKSLLIRGAKFGIPAGPAAVPANRGTNESIIQGSLYYGQSRDSITVDGFTVNAGSAVRGIQARGYNSVIINNIVTGTPDPFSQQAGISTRANGPLRLHSYLISNNNVRGFRFGIYMDGNLEDPSLISYNYVTNCLNVGYEFTASNGHHIQANVSDNNSIGMTFTEGSNLIDQNTIVNNVLIGIRLGGTPFLSSNLITNNFINNNGAGIALTDPDPGATNNVANFNSMVGNTINIASVHTANFNAQCNWYGTVNPGTIAAQITGNVTFNPFLTDGTDTDPALDGFQPTTTCVVVPIILSDFSAAVKNYDVLLKWETASEVNSSHFIIERSLDNVHFYAIGRVGAKGFSDLKNLYYFTDNKPVNFDRPTYYRLQMVDRDGTSKNSKILSVVLKSGRSFIQQVYPNPVKSGKMISANFISSTAEKIDISFVNSVGQVISQQQFQAVKGLNQFIIQAPAGASAGVNFVRVKSSDAIQQVPVYIY